MTLTRIRLFVGILILLAGEAAAQGAAPPPRPDRDSLTFVPPAIGTPSDRIGAGARDATVDPGGAILMQIPEGGGLTSDAAPPLVWRLPRGFDGVMQIRFGPVQGGGILRWRDGDLAPGYFGLDLAGAGLTLEPGVIYRLRVLLVDRADGAIAAEAWGLVERVEPARPDAAPAAEGRWFDAIEPFFTIAPDGQAILTNGDDYVRLAASAEVLP